MWLTLKCSAALSALVTTDANGFNAPQVEKCELLAGGD